VHTGSACNGPGATHFQDNGERALLMNPSLAAPDARTAAVAEAMQQLRSDGHVPGWRDELYPVAASFGADPMFLVERAAAPILGIKGYGVHVNGFVRRHDGLHLWVATRSKDKPSWPGKLDHISAGGQVCSTEVSDVHVFSAVRTLCYNVDVVCCTETARQPCTCCLFKDAMSRMCASQ
jgi:Domain of unknown function (DUF4743)